MQTNYNKEMELAFDGMTADSYQNRNVISRAAQYAAIAFGYGLVEGLDTEKQCSVPFKETATLVFAGDFVASNVINLKVNGVAIAPVTWSADHDTTAGLLATAIAALTGVTCILDPGDATNKTYIITALGTDITVTEILVTLGAGQTTGTATYASVGVFLGIAGHEHKEANSAGVSNYTVGEAVNVVNEGKIWVPVTVAVTRGTTAYIIAATTDKGKFTNASSGNISSGGVFKTSTTGAGRAIVKIRTL